MRLIRLDAKAYVDPREVIGLRECTIDLEGKEAMTTVLLRGGGQVVALCPIANVVAVLSEKPPHKGTRAYAAQALGLLKVSA